MMRTFMLAAASAAVFTLSPTVFGQQSDHGTAVQAKAMLLKAEAAVKADKTKAISMFNNGEGGFLDRDLYVFCANTGDGKLVANGNPNAKQFIGTDARALKDATGKPYGVEVYGAAQKPPGQITEVRYMFPKPGADPKPVPKVSLVTRVDDLVCGVGYYQQSILADDAVGRRSTVPQPPYSLRRATQSGLTKSGPLLANTGRLAARLIFF